MDAGAHVFYASPPARRRDGWRSADATRAMREVLAELRERARRTLGLGRPRWAQGPSGAPLPEAGWCWSASHARGHVALAVAAGARIGLDLEALDRPRPLHVAERLAALGAAPAELAEPAALLALWTRVEAVLKLHGAGLGGLGRLGLGGGAVAFDGVRAALQALPLPGLAATLASPDPLPAARVYPAAAAPTVTPHSALRWGPPT